MKEKYIVYFISKTKKRMTQFIEDKLREKGIKDLVPSHGNILTVLYENNGRLTMKEISRLIGKDKSTVTALVNKLLNLEYIEKEKSLKDKRVTYITLTEKGKNIEEVFKSISGEIYQTAYKGFSEEEKEIFLQLLKKINDNFKNAKEEEYY
ncbi:MarR family transcriptional regulator [Clostridium sp. D2Q-11]|uniref:MarR family transcriptional regulator n=1 Tax=Anaeromonas frigoriresistens TaxID=2683708 RepID=A0A942Z921_9FIRM|nr:MarR family transcriptional regulator [Anaeromonas frigoriresistens]MBS4538629.1 MarR family transcriptional regulator [Anaeromonas frigoriresistens]